MENSSTDGEFINISASLQTKGLPGGAFCRVAFKHHLPKSNHSRSRVPQEEDFQTALRSLIFSMTFCMFDDFRSKSLSVNVTINQHLRKFTATSRRYLHSRSLKSNRKPLLRLITSPEMHKHQLDHFLVPFRESLRT